MPDLALVVNLLVALLGGGALGVLLTYRYRMAQLKAGERDTDRVDFETIVTELRVQRDEFKEFSERQLQRNAQLEAEIQGLRLARDLDPFPNWVVDRNSEYLYVNREFERCFLEPLGRTYRDAIGETHESLGWPKEFCETLKRLDHAARTRPDGTARATTTLSIPEIGKSRVTVHKFPIRFKPSGVIVAYAGYITGIEPEDELIGLPEGTSA